MAIARIRTYFINSKFVHFYTGQNSINQIVVLIAAAMAIPFFINLQIFELFSIIRDSIQGYEVNNVLLVTLLAEVGLIFYSLYLYATWAYASEKKEAIKVKDFSRPPDFLVIEEYKPLLPDGKSISEQSEIAGLVKNKDVQAIIAANADPLSFFEKLRPIDDAVREETKKYKAESINEDIGTGTLADIMRRTQKAKSHN